jgi:hypothetical protein
MGVMCEAMQREMALRGFARRTHRTYIGWMRRLVRHARVSADQVSEAKGRSANTYRCKAGEGYRPRR